MKTILLSFLVSCVCFAQNTGIMQFATGFDKPVAIAHYGNSDLFIVEKVGKIKIISSNGTSVSTLFLDITAKVSTGNEQGLLGLAFHPNYSINGYFYVNYTNRSGDTVIARYSVSPTNPNQANAASELILLTITQPYSNHNGGTIKFDSDGFLFIGMGDGGNAGDPLNNAQNLNSLLGKMLRIDVDNPAPGKNYGIPSTNPYAGSTAGADEIWAIGLRNPWKFSFDKATNDLWIADVGQSLVEEVNKATINEAGLNYGWKCFEGNIPYAPANCTPTGSVKVPIASISHDDGACSITGGYVYRGSNYPNLVGKYLFSDYCDSRIGIIDSNTGALSYTPANNNNFVAFGEDNTGELYVVDIGSTSTNGTIYKIQDLTLLNNSTYSNDFFKLYPNPVSDELSIIKNNESNIQIIEVVIMDNNGRVLVSEKNNLGIEKVNFSNLSNGIYLVKITDDNQNSALYKIVK